jgi:energy-converting hydrogenase Eha subunit A
MSLDLSQIAGMIIQVVQMIIGMLPTIIQLMIVALILRLIISGVSIRKAVKKTEKGGE